MSQRLWENPDYKDETFKKLMAKLDKCIRRERYVEAGIVLNHLMKECQLANEARVAVRNFRVNARMGIIQ